MCTHAAIAMRTSMQNAQGTPEHKDSDENFSEIINPTPKESRLACMLQD